MMVAKVGDSVLFVAHGRLRLGRVVELARTRGNVEWATASGSQRVTRCRLVAELEPALERSAVAVPLLCLAPSFWQRLRPLVGKPPIVALEFLRGRHG